MTNACGVQTSSAGTLTVGCYPNCDGSTSAPVLNVGDFTCFLQEAFTKNAALLMGQYDLHTFLGDERLAFLVKDLKDLAQRNKNDPRPVFLLSYIAYNTGNERNAAAYLDLAEKRSNGKDPFFGTLRKHWTLPEAAPEVGAEMNK